MKIMRLRQVEETTGLKKTAIYARITEGRFPQPVNLDGKAVGWVESEIQDWLAERVAARPSKVSETPAAAA